MGSWAGNQQAKGTGNITNGSFRESCFALSAIASLPRAYAPNDRHGHLSMLSYVNAGLINCLHRSAQQSRQTPMSRFVSGGTADEPIERDDAWLKAQQEIEAKRLEKEEQGRQQDGKSLFETLQANKGE